MKPIRIAIVGLGKIARDQHIPAVIASPRYELIATVDPLGTGLQTIPHYQGLEALIDAGLNLDAVVLCTPPQMRCALAIQSLQRGLHVFLEKPPGAALSEVGLLQELAKQSGLTLFAGWHSRFAAAIETARQWLSKREIKRVDIVWREDVRVWHPKQDWIWQAGGLGVFDPGINALSIVTSILPQPIFLRDAALIYPENRHAPIAAELSFSDARGTPVAMDLDWRQTGLQTWDITVETDDGICHLSKGGAELNCSGVNISGEEREYTGLYAYFAELIKQQRSDVDISPFCLVADAFLRGDRRMVEPFFD